MHVRVYEARHHNLVSGVLDFVSGCVEFAADRLDSITGEQELAPLEIAYGRVERD
jgi:hypothetical protein